MDSSGFVCVVGSGVTARGGGATSATPGSSVALAAGGTVTGTGDGASSALESDSSPSTGACPVPLAGSSVLARALSNSSTG